MNKNAVVSAQHAEVQIGYLEFISVNSVLVGAMLDERHSNTDGARYTTSGFSYLARMRESLSLHNKEK